MRIKEFQCFSLNSKLSPIEFTLASMSLIIVARENQGSWRSSRDLSEVKRRRTGRRQRRWSRRGASSLLFRNFISPRIAPPEFIARGTQPSFHSTPFFFLFIFNKSDHPPFSSLPALRFTSAMNNRPSKMQEVISNGKRIVTFANRNRYFPICESDARVRAASHGYHDVFGRVDYIPLWTFAEGKSVRM